MARHVSPCCCTLLLLHQDQKRPVPRSEPAAELRAPLRNRAVDLLLTIHNSAGSSPRGESPGNGIRRASYCPGPPWGRKFAAPRTGPCRWAAGVKEPTCSVLGQSVRAAADQSRSGRRSDDLATGGGTTWNACSPRCCLDCQANSNPRPSPRFKTTSSPMRRGSGRTEHEVAGTRIRRPL
jgi:hypothetical protein